MSHDAFAHADGAYVLGALEPAERRAFVEHMRTCAACSRSVRELAGLPSLLSQVDETMLDSPLEVPPVPDTLLPGLLREVRRRRRRRLAWALAGSAAAAVVTVAGIGVWTQGDGTQPGGGDPVVSTGSPGQAMEQVDQNLVRASLAMESVPWGTRLQLTCTYNEAPGPYSSPAPTYALVVHTRDGRSEQVATWRAVPGRTTTLSAATASRTAEITSVDVRTMTGQPVLKLGS